KSGPISMLQVEHAYGSFGNDKKYLEELRKYWLQNGIDIPFYTADGPNAALLEAGTLDDAVIGLDSGSSEADFERAKKIHPGLHAFSSETYTGWLTHWGEKWASSDTNHLKKELTWLLVNNKSFNLYLVHGGTNFGFTAGANAFSPTQFQPDVTSYDYDAPISEQGRATPKFFMIRELIRRFTTQSLPPVPSPVETISIPPFEMIYSNTIWNGAGRYVRSVQPRPIEEFDQGQGLVIYRTELVGHKGGKLTIREPHDYALVFLNHHFIDTVFRDGGKWTIDLPAPDINVINPVLEILVEAMGHINYGEFMPDRKGITERVTLNGMTLMNWEISLLPMDSTFIEMAAGPSRGIANDKPGIFFRGRFNLEKTGDTYFDMSHFSKGMVYMNGHNLGRYWNLGPQQRLYCPAAWLNKGENQVIVFDLHRLEGEMIRGMPGPD
ncbi:MAG TPA: beta-galactosidase, partial [Chitinophagaceae bacterium]|nr:beta-galactosidase [Chitinophagaceae bacterium]